MAGKQQPPRQDRAARRSERKQAAIAARKRQQQRKLILYVAVAAVAVAGFLIFLNRPADDEVPEIDFASVPQTGATLGDSNATVQIVEYADYQCPFCGDFALEVVPQLVEDYVQTGQASFEFRAHPFLGDAPLDSPDNESVQAAEAAACALDQGKFWEYNHLLFEKQDGENNGAYSTERLKGFAAELGLDEAAFNQCLDSGQHQQEVLDQLASGEAAGISSTPTIIINGQVVQYTTQGYDLLKRQIDAALAGEPMPQ